MPILIFSPVQIIMTHPLPFEPFQEVWFSLKQFEFVQNSFEKDKTSMARGKVGLCFLCFTYLSKLFFHYTYELG